MIENVLKMVAFFLTLKLSECGNMEPFIVGGSYASIYEFPHSVFLVMHCQDSWVCGSSILNQRVLLTAAHCLNDCKKNFQIVAYAGHSNLDKMRIMKRAKRLAIHENYDPKTIECDIGLVYLQRTLPLGRYVKRVIVRTVFPWNLKEAMVAGWGIVNDETGEFTQTLKRVNQKVLGLQTCTTRMPMKAGMMCAESFLHDHRPTEGDSGSALVTARNEQIGLVSFRRKKNRDLIVYTNVTYFYSWIQSAAKLLHCRN